MTQKGASAAHLRRCMTLAMDLPWCRAMRLAAGLQLRFLRTRGWVSNFYFEIVVQLRKNLKLAGVTEVPR